MSEKDFQRQVIDLAHIFGWLVAHFRASQNKYGRWSTAVQADGAGFPDLVLVKDRVIWVELKAEGGKLSPEQEKWRDALLSAKQEWYCWTPKDLDIEIMEVLR